MSFANVLASLLRVYSNPLLIDFLKLFIIFLLSFIKLFLALKVVYGTSFAYLPTLSTI